MAQKNNGGKVSRRSILKKSAGTSLGVAGLSQSALAWEKASPDDIEAVRTTPEVQTILKDLEQNRLPSDGKTRTFSIEGRGEIVTTRVELEYGTLQFGKSDIGRNATFEFDSVTHPDVPSKFKNIPPETEPVLIADGEEVIVTREATDRERDIVLSKVPSRGEQASVFVRSDINGFEVRVAKNTSSVDDLEIEQYTVTVPDVDADLALRDTSKRLADKGELSIATGGPAAAGGVQIQGVRSKLIKDYVMDVFKNSLGEAAHECGSNCIGCADWIVSLALDCRLCGPVCTSAASGPTAVVCAVCVYQWCKDVESMVGCADCIGCAVDGNSNWDSPTKPSLQDIIGGVGSLW